MIEWALAIAYVLIGCVFLGALRHKTASVPHIGPEDQAVAMVAVVVLWPCAMALCLGETLAKLYGPDPSADGK